MKDFQRSRVYAWERQEFEWDDSMMTLEQCQRLVDEINNRFCIGGLLVTDGRRCRNALACYSSSKIKLPKWARRKWVVLHEVSHFLAIGNKHGPDFVARYLDLLASYYKRDRDVLKASAIDSGVAVAY